MSAVAKTSAVPAMKRLCREELADLIRNQLETDNNLDFLLELKEKELTVLADCISERMSKPQRIWGYSKQELLV